MLRRIRLYGYTGLALLLAGILGLVIQSWVPAWSYRLQQNLTYRERFSASREIGQCLEDNVDNLNTLEAGPPYNKKYMDMVVLAIQFTAGDEKVWNNFFYHLPECTLKYSWITEVSIEFIQLEVLPTIDDGKVHVYGHHSYTLVFPIDQIKRLREEDDNYKFRFTLYNVSPMGPVYIIQTNRPYNINEYRVFHLKEAIQYTFDNSNYK